MARFQSIAVDAESKSNIEPNSEAETTQNKKNFNRSPGNGNRKPYSRKLADISRQIDVSTKEADPKNLTEAIDIYEEGVSYLREVQQDEGIEEEHLYRVFQKPASVLLESAIKGGDEAVIDRVLNVFVANRVAHLFHFTMYQQYLLTQGSARFPDVLSLWLRYLEYSKSLVLPISTLSTKNISYHAESQLQPYDMLNLTYFAYVILCQSAGVEQNINDTVKLLQLRDISQVPHVRNVRSALNKLGLSQTLSEELKTFEELSRSTFIKTLDPNGESMANKIFGITKKGNANQLRHFYQQMVTASIENELALTEDTLTRVMSAFIELYLFHDALDVFTTMVGSFKPSATSWALAIKAMGHPKYVENLSADERQKVSENIKSTLASMEAIGVPVNAKTLAVTIGAMSNLDYQDEVKQLLAKYKSVPVVHLTKHNILLGLILNNKVNEAEQLMKTYLQEDSSYIPLIQLLNAFLSHYVSVGNDKATDAMMQFMSERKIVADLGTITTVVNYYFKTCKINGQIPDVKSVLSEVGRSDIKWDTNMASTLLSGLTQDESNLDAARGVFNYFIDLSPQYKNSPAMYTPMIKAELDFGDSSIAFELFEWYNQHLKVETRTWNMMITGFLNSNESKALKLYNQMIEESVAPNFFTYYYMLLHFMKKGNAKRTQWVLDEMAASRLKNFGQVLPALVDKLKLKYNVSHDLLKRMEGSNLS